MSDSYTVIESTPGYMPDDDEPPTFDSYDDAVAYLNERAAEYAQDPDGNYRVEYGIASQDNLAAVIVWDDDKMHDLGRVIQIVRDDLDDDDDDDDAPTDDAPTDDDEPDDDDAYITDVPRGHSVSFAGKFLGVYVERDAAERAISQAMSDTGFWPNVWHVSDHGNVDQVTNMLPITEPTDDDDTPKRCGAWKAETHEDRGAIDCGCGWGAFCELSAEYVGPEPHSFTIEQARSILEGTPGYETR